MESSLEDPVPVDPGEMFQYLQRIVMNRSIGRIELQHRFQGEGTITNTNSDSNPNP
jgi:hypothetical protein